VILVRQPGAEGIVARAETRVAAELRAAGFEVEEKVEEPPAPDGDESDTGPPDTVATVVLTRARGGAATEIRVFDHVTKKTVVRRIETSQGGEGVLALRVVELMRASLVEPLVVAAPPDPAVPPAAPPLPPHVRDFTLEGTHPAAAAGASYHFALGAEAAAVASGDSLGVAWAPALDLSLDFADVLRARLLFVGPAFGASVDGTAGTATIRQELALAELAWEPVRRTAPVQPFLALGAGPYHLDARGSAHAPFVDAEDDVWALATSLGAGLRFRLAPVFYVVAGARALLLAPRPVVAFGSTDVAEAGRPGLIGTLGIEVDP
jgi:hypothetical protein